MRKGGTAKSIRNMTIWLIILTIALILIEKRSNYTELHRRVKVIEVWISQQDK